MAKKPKFYVVWKGRETGIFETWEECRAQVESFSGAEYKSYDSLDQAKAAFMGSYKERSQRKNPDGQISLDAESLRRVGQPIDDSFSVDAACSGNPGPLEYRCVHTLSGQEVFRQGPFDDGTNNVGEFLAIVHALASFRRQGIVVPIYSDSETAIKWVERRKCRTKLAQTERNSELFDLIFRAERWLSENDYLNRVIKWETEYWGDIPSDFGRK